MANRRLGVRHRLLAVVDGHGNAVSGDWGLMLGPWPGRAEERPDVPMGRPGGRPWVLAVDPAAWPVGQVDLIVDPDSGQTWTVTSADLLANTAISDIDYVRIEGHLRTGTGTRA
jgi:hypothetical protein